MDYNSVLEAALPVSVQMICYADDTLLIAGSKEWTRTLETDQTAVAALTARIKDLGLEVAVQKTEALWLHGLRRTRRPPTSWLAVQGSE